MKTEKEISDKYTLLMKEFLEGATAEKDALKRFRGGGTLAQLRSNLILLRWILDYGVTHAPTT